MNEDMKAFCTKCGASLPPDSQFCSECGNPVDQPDMMYNYGQSRSTGSGYPTDQYGISSLAQAKAEGRLTWIYILLIGYIIIGTFSALGGLSYEYFLNIIESDPELINTIGQSNYDMLVSLKEVMFLVGIVLLISVISVLASLILSIMKRMHKVAVAACAMGSLVTLVMIPFGIIDGIILVLIGLTVTYVLYTTGPAFVD